MGKLRKRKTAIIFGITGQDGSYLAELLLKKKLYYSRGKEKIIECKYRKNRSFV